MAQKVRTYDPKKNSVIINGVALIGFHEGTYITIKPGSARVTKMVGGDGAVARVMSTDRSATLEVTLQQTSPSNDFLSALELADAVTGAGLATFLHRDASGRTLVAAPECWVGESPELGYGKNTIEGRKWVIDIADCDYFVGGN